MDIVLFILYVISLVVMADTKLKEFPAGLRFLNGLEDGTVSTLRWRADSDPSLDMIGIKKALLISTTILFILIFFMVSNEIELNIYIVSVFLVNLLLLSSVQWFLDIKKETMKMFGFIGFAVISPWLMYFFGESVGISSNFIDKLIDQNSQFEIFQGSDYFILGNLSILLFICSAMILVLWIIMVTVPSIILLWFIKIVNRVSILLVNIERQKVQLFFVGINILVPIWFFAKDRVD